MVNHANVGDLVKFKPTKNSQWWTDELDNRIHPGEVGIVLSVKEEESVDDLDPTSWFSHNIFITNRSLETPGWHVQSFEILSAFVRSSEGEDENPISARS